MTAQPFGYVLVAASRLREGETLFAANDVYLFHDVEEAEASGLGAAGAWTVAAVVPLPSAEAQT